MTDAGRAGVAPSREFDDRTSAADGPPGDAEMREGAATGSGCRALYCLLAGWLLREASTPDSG